ncbi:MAG: NAD(+)/NADH kinase, partial [Anaerolineales bacterium]
MSAPPHSFLVVANPQLAEALELAEQISDELSGRELRSAWGSLNDESFRRQVAENPADLFIALGGDGTMLRAGQLCAPLDLPILGINLGRFGFLTEVRREEWQAALERVIRGDYWLEQRMMLQAVHHRQDRELGTWEALNECFIGRGETVRPVDLTAEIDQRHLTTYVADGLIIATPTGSTAYALAAGGPILSPELRNILLVPVAPHLSVERPIVLHEGSTVRVTVRTTHQAILSVDGGSPVPLQSEDSVQIRAGRHVVRFARLQDPGYFYRNLTSRMNQVAV